MLVKNMIYLDNAATTFPKPASVLRAAEEAITIYGGNPGRGGHKMAMRASEMVFDTRKNLAEFFSCEPQNVIFTQNCTMALNYAIKGLFNEGNHVLCSCLEHNSVLRPLNTLKEKGIIDYDIVDIAYCDDEIISSFKSKIKCTTKGIICTHASNVSGRIMPIQKIGQMCRELGLYFIVDAAQSAGVIPINMKTSNITALCIPGHKGLYGISGSGALLLNDGEVLNTVIEGGTGSLSSELVQPDFTPDRLEAGTINTVGILSMNAGLEFVKKLTPERIYKYEMDHCKKVYEALFAMENIRLYQTPYKEGVYLPIVSFNIGRINSEQVVEMLNKSNFALRGGLHCAPLAHKYYGTLDSGMVRFAPSVFTSENDIKQFVKNISLLSAKKY